MDDAQGWYADPSGRHQFRWWDGARWTAHVGDDGEPSFDDGVLLPPAPPSVVLAAPTERSVAGIDAPDEIVEGSGEAEAPPRRAWDDVRARPLWARLGAVVVIVAAIAAIAATTRDDPKPRATVEIEGFVSPTTARPTPASVLRAVPSTAAPTTRPTSPPTTVPRPTAPPTTPTTPAPPPTPPPAAEPLAPASGCDPNYSPCVPIASDVDCANGSGNGPAYVNGPVTVIGQDIYGLDSNGDGIGCESNGS
jgi:uncharacterized protein DUF2510